jgi:putative ATP-dependent endonuclease of OLD family
MTDGDKGMDDSDDEDEAVGQASDAEIADSTEDSGASKDQQPETTKTSIPGQQRKADLEALAKRLEADSQLAAVTSTYSLETELLEAGNNSITHAKPISCSTQGRKRNGMQLRQ